MISLPLVSEYHNLKILQYHGSGLGTNMNVKITVKSNKCCLGIYILYTCYSCPKIFSSWKISVKIDKFSFLSQKGHY